MTIERLIHLVIYPCRQATLLMERRRHGTLTLTERVRLRWHLALCKSCRAYLDKTDQLDRLMQQQGHEETKKNFPEEDARVEQIKEDMKKKLGL